MRNSALAAISAAAALATALLSTACAPPIVLGADAAPNLSDSVLAASPVEAQVVKWPQKSHYALGDEVLIAAHTGNTGFVIPHAVGDRAPIADVLVWPDQRQYEVGEQATIYVRTGSEPGFVTVVQVDADGAGHVIYPRSPAEWNYLTPDSTMAIKAPAESGTFTVHPATGTSLLYAVISPDRLDLAEFKEGSEWRPEAFHLDAATADATTERWGGVYWEMKDLAATRTDRPFASNVVAYSVVNSAAASRTLYAPIGASGIGSWVFFPIEINEGRSEGFINFGMVPCGYRNGLPLYDARFCAWADFEAQYAEDRSAAGLGPPLTKTPAAPLGPSVPHHPVPKTPLPPPAFSTTLFASAPHAAPAHPEPAPTSTPPAFAPRANEAPHLWHAEVIHVGGAAYAVAPTPPPPERRNAPGSVSWSGTSGGGESGPAGSLGGGSTSRYEGPGGGGGGEAWHGSGGGALSGGTSVPMGAGGGQPLGSPNAPVRPPR